MIRIPDDVPGYVPLTGALGPVQSSWFVGDEVVAPADGTSGVA